MRNILIASFFTFLFVFSGCKSNKPSGSSDASGENSLLWKISGNGLSKESYLFGTIHLICSKDFEFTGKAEESLKNSELLVLELDMDDPSLQAELLKGTFMKDGEKLENLLTKEEFERASKFFKEKLGMELSGAQTMKPFFLYSMLLPQALNCSERPASYEQHLMKLAKEQGKEIEGIEDVKDQIQVFEDIPYKEQAQMLIKLIDEKDKTSKMFSELVSYYKSGDINKMHELTNDQEMSLGDHQEKLLDNRNMKWISAIKELSGKQSVFYGVGAAHLAGEKGVIKLLRNEGFTVEPIAIK